MAISNDQLLELFDAALAADYTRLRRLGSAVAKSLSTTDEDMARSLRALIRRKGVPLRASGYGEALPLDSKSRLPLVEEQPWPSTPIFLEPSLEHVMSGFIEDVRHVDLLMQKGISTRLCLLLSGQPGTGKSLLAGHVAAQLGRPLYVVRLDSAISSLLGDTAKNVRSIFDYVPSRDGILFLDEMDAIAKLRDDRHELGELKRVVNTVIQGLDSLDDRAIVIGATNHPQLLDPAIWRRFPYKLNLEPPSEAVNEEMWRYFLFGDEGEHILPSVLAKISSGLSGADIQTIALTARRQAVLGDRQIDGASVAWAALGAMEDNPATPPRDGLSADQKRSLALALSRLQINVTDAATVVGVSRPTFYSYIKGESDGD